MKKFPAGNHVNLISISCFMLIGNYRRRASVVCHFDSFYDLRNDSCTMSDLSQHFLAVNDLMDAPSTLLTHHVTRNPSSGQGECVRLKRDHKTI